MATLELITVAQAKITWVLYVHLRWGWGAGSVVFQEKVTFALDPER